jgi:hypothetical protein
MPSSIHHGMHTKADARSVELASSKWLQNESARIKRAHTATEQVTGDVTGGAMDG